MNSFCIALILAATLSIALASNCYGPTTQLLVDEFNAFPSPVSVGQTVYIRAKITPKQIIYAAQVQVRVYYTTETNLDVLTPVINMQGIDFCTISSKFSCPLTNTTSSILNWEFIVPDVPPGTYQVKYNIVQTTSTADGSTSCIQFKIVVGGTNNSPVFTSWYEASLLGTAAFSNSPSTDYTQRKPGDMIQVGPGGPLNDTLGLLFGIPNGPPYGSIKGLVGSGDLVPSFVFNTSAFVWGLSGVMVKKNIGYSKAQQSHIYEGNCYLGYINGPSQYDYVHPLLSGTFTLNLTYIDGSTAQINGVASFSPNATIPPAWGYPLLFGRLQQHQIVTSDVGFLMIKGSAPYCTDGSCKLGASPSSSGGSSGLSSDKLGLAIGLPIAVVFVVVLVAAALLWAKQRRETEQEDGIFAVARKPEYGSALVVDDIIEETRGNKNLRSMLNANTYSEDEGSEEEDDDRSERSRSRSLSRDGTSRSASLSRSRSRSQSSARSSRAASDDESDPGESASRGRSSESEYSD